ncbi:MAG: putative selenium-dependent hydroxylase accessory protein YqeC [Lachnospiraceae bacterium]|nr:putative selenium-dependent hydroxylase accessory protein YqeC [Lachnospiraceae bacterium]
MAHITAVVGAGGKTSLMERLAEQYAAKNIPVAITTTTKIASRKDRGLIRYFGKEIAPGKLAFPGEEVFRKLCAEYPYVLVEADGARHHPVKIPNDTEPVIPEDTERIIVVTGCFALQRAFGEICHRSRLADYALLGERFPGFCADTRLTKEHLDFLAAHYYLEPLKKQYPAAKVEYFFNAPETAEAVNPLRIRNIGLVLMASGLSSRFPSNKLLHPFRGRELYRHGMDALLETKARLRMRDERLSGIFAAEEARDGAEADPLVIDAEVFAVSRFPEILANPDYRDRVTMVDNPYYEEGIAASVRLGLGAAKQKGCDAVLYLVADEPFFTAEHLTTLIREYLVTGKRFACAYAGYESNPAVFHISAEQELNALQGDKGPIGIIRRNPHDAHCYIVAPETILDIDEEKDLIS